VICNKQRLAIVLSSIVLHHSPFRGIVKQPSFDTLTFMYYSITFHIHTLQLFLSLSFEMSTIGKQER
jgi:hypothetical protein